MDRDFYFRGLVDAQIVNGVLYVPQKVTDFCRLRRSYALGEEQIEGFKYLAIYPKLELVRSLLREGITSKKLPSEFIPLEKIARKDGTKGLRLPAHSLEYLNTNANSTVKIIGGGSYYFGIWKPEDFETYGSLADLEVVTSALAEKGI